MRACGVCGLPLRHSFTSFAVGLSFESLFNQGLFFCGCPCAVNRSFLFSFLFSASPFSNTSHAITSHTGGECSSLRRLLRIGRCVCAGRAACKPALQSIAHPSACARGLCQARMVPPSGDPAGGIPCPGIRSAGVVHASVGLGPCPLGILFLCELQRTPSTREVCEEEEGPATRVWKGGDENEQELSPFLPSSPSLPPSPSHCYSCSSPTFLQALLSTGG